MIADYVFLVIIFSVVTAAESLTLLGDRTLRLHMR
jgi:hypothetical protein